MNTYTKEEIKKIAHEFLNAVKAKTGWRTNGVVYMYVGTKPYLNIQAPGWNNRKDLNNKWKLDDYFIIEEAFNRKYKDIGFSVSDGDSGKRVASCLMKIAKDLCAMSKRLRSRCDNLQNYKIAKNIVAGDVTKEYIQKRQSLDSAISFFRKELAEHDRKQKKDPDNLFFVSDLKDCINEISFLEHKLKIRG